jgi:hypothetical protein
MKDALDVVMAWQLRNPNVTDPTAAIEAVKVSRAEKTDSELSFRLASHFLQLTIPPLFPQNKPTSNALEASRQPAPWKDSVNQYALDLLGWTISVLDPKTIEAKWHLLMPPILKMMDDVATEWKARGCHMLGLLLENLHQTVVAGGTNKPIAGQDSAKFLHRTGYHNIFAEALLPMFTYIPSITPEAESVTLLKEVFPTVTLLAQLLPADTDKGDSRERFLDRILREGVLSPLAHFPRPSSYAELATLIMSHVPVLLGLMGIGTVKHLPDLMPLLSIILQEPLELSHKPLLLSTLKASQSVQLNAWPRLPAHRGTIMMGMCLLWSRCIERQKMTNGEDIKHLMSEVQESVAMLDAIMQAAETDGLGEAWEKEKQGVMQASPGFEELFEKCMTE